MKINRKLAAGLAALALAASAACIPIDDGQQAIGQHENRGKRNKPTRTPSPSPPASESPSPSASPSSPPVSPSTQPSPSVSPSPSPSPSLDPVSVPRVGATSATFDTFNGGFPANGKLMSERIYETSIPVAYGGRSQTAHNAGRVVWYSVKPSIPSVADGLLTGAIDTWLATFPTTGSDFYLTFYHEPEDNIAAGQFTLPQWKAAVTKLAERVKLTSNPRLRVYMSLAGPWTFSPNSSYSGWDWDSALPWLDSELQVKVSTVCADPYYDLLGKQMTSAVMDPPAWPRSFMDYARSHAVPVCLAEFGIRDENGASLKDAYVADAWSWAKAQGGVSPVIDMMYFNYKPADTGNNWPLLGVWSGLSEDTAALVRYHAMAMEARS